VKGTALPENWEPTNDDREYGHRKLHLSDEQIDGMAEDMRLWAGANENRAIARKAGMKGWSMAFKGWMRRVAKQQETSNGGLHGRGRNGGSASATAGRLAELAERGEFSFGPRPGSVLPAAGGDDVRLLPEGRGGKS
jgi:hypothetical protein